MTEELNEPKKYVIDIDDKDDPKLMTLQIPIGETAKDNSMNGIIYLMGYFEHCKNQAIQAVMMKRAKDANGKSKIIVAEKKPIPMGVIH